MKAKGIFISVLLVIDTFFVSYAAGFHSRHVLVVNPKLPPVVQKKVEAKPILPTKPAPKSNAKDGHGKKGSVDKAHGAKSHDIKRDAKSADTSAKSAAKTAASSTTKSDSGAKASTGKSTPKASATKPSMKKTTTPKPSPKPTAKPGPGA
jgi:hypothetical protein